LSGIDFLTPESDPKSSPRFVQNGVDSGAVKTADEDGWDEIQK
jgi:hypothetical protein